MTATSERRPIVLGIDAMDRGPLSAAWAADEAARRDLPLRLIHVIPPRFRDPRGYDESFHAELWRTGRRLVEKAAFLARGRHPDLEVSSDVVDGHASHVLIEESKHAELVVLGSRGLSRLEEVLSAHSVTAPVSSRAACPVVVVREPEHVTQDPPYVVVGVDGSRSSATAVDCAFDLASWRGAGLRALWVWQPLPFLPVDEDAAFQRLRGELYEATVGRADRYPEVELTHEVVRGHPVEELAKASAHALAVVVGRRGHGGFTGMWLGSVPHGLLHRTHCPAVIVPPDIR
ncbi:universal stress protein [Kitasatospora sp. NPDC056138]|uniref:universal stress protein n=1 Tax=Kitasatospora sp. NPDC056138 TaxID=3345724 RepID=UPI0035DEB58A